MLRWLAIAVCTTLILGCSSRPPSATEARTPSAPALALTESEALPLVIVVRADWCPSCRKIEPTIAALMREYEGRVRFLVLDVTDDAKTARSKVAAENAGVGKFFAENEATGVVAIFNAKGRLIGKLAGETDLTRYRDPLATAAAEP